MGGAPDGKVSKRGNGIDKNKGALQRPNLGLSTTANVPGTCRIVEGASLANSTALPNFPVCVPKLRHDNRSYDRKAAPPLAQG
jgi:hypothetical protein